MPSPERAEVLDPGEAPPETRVRPRRKRRSLESASARKAPAARKEPVIKTKTRDPHGRLRRMLRKLKAAEGDPDLFDRLVRDIRAAAKDLPADKKKRVRMHLARAERLQGIDPLAEALDTLIKATR